MKGWFLVMTLSVLAVATLQCGPSQPANDPLTQGIPAPGESRANPDPQWGTSGSAPGTMSGKPSPSSAAGSQPPPAK
jgi:hypothetical protein